MYLAADGSQIAGLQMHEEQRPGVTSSRSRVLLLIAFSNPSLRQRAWGCRATNIPGNILRNFLRSSLPVSCCAGCCLLVAAVGCCWLAAVLCCAVVKQASFAPCSNLLTGQSACALRSCRSDDAKYVCDHVLKFQSAGGKYGPPTSLLPPSLPAYVFVVDILTELDSQRCKRRLCPAFLLLVCVAAGASGGWALPAYVFVVDILTD